MIAIVDYDAGNLHSVAKAAERAGLPAVVTDRPGDIDAAEGVILPGVGAFADCMDRLRRRALVEPLQAYLAADRPFLGICLGLQVLFEWGEEGPGAAGLGFFPGRVRRIRAPGRKIPHMGWNSLRLRRSDPLFAGIPEGDYFYFVHSFHVIPSLTDDLVADVEYGETVTAAVGRGRVHAVQFHPEKSSASGLRLLGNFGRLVREGTC